MPITDTLERPRFGTEGFGGDGEPLDYAVRMRRFPQEALLSGRQVSPELIERIAERAAGFHNAIPAAASDTAFGTPETVFFPMQQNFDQIRGLVSDAGELARLDPLEAWSRAAYQRLTPLLQRRKEGGHIRECHGDMHLGNIALVDDEVVIFDGIEFNPDLCWIDTMNDAAFLVMDLEQAGEQALARRFLNRYLEIGGDYQALALLDFYKVYRALVRAKVTAIRLGQPDLTADDQAAVLAEYGRYVALAESYTRERGSALMITHGVSGSGKTHASGPLLEAIGAVRVRSDIERKRLFGLGETEASGSGTADGIYSADAGERTYGRLRELARQILEAGYPALVDATFLKRSQRQAFAELARELGRPLVILDLRADETQLRQRIEGRLAAGGDASEADVTILEHQLATREPLDAAELAAAVAVDSAEPLPLEEIRGRMVA